MSSSRVAVSKPFPHEHAARQADPAKYDTFRRQHPKGFPAGVDVIFGIKNGKSEIQTLRFNSSLWTVAAAKKWLKDHNFKATIEAASKKSDAQVRAKKALGELIRLLGGITSAGQESVSKSLYVPILKADAEEQTLTGVVLQPEVVDAQGDIISVQVIRTAAHKFLANFNKTTKLGLQHRVFKSGQFALVESYLAPSDMSIGSQVVKSGSWVMVVKVLDAKLWKMAKDGKLTGFSIGGKAKVQQLASQQT